jgi:hypothetical protein
MAAPLLEGQPGGTAAFSLPVVFRSTAIATEQQVVTDCPADAWDESDQQAIADLRSTFGEDLVETHETALRRAGHWLIETHLRTEWRKRGFGVAFTNYVTTDPGSDLYAVPADEVFQEVWQAAADAITDQDLVLEASLGHVFQLRTDLQRHREALHHRLDQWASSDMCHQAEQQLDGLRAAVDIAVTRAQLIELSAQIPSV